MSARIRSVVVNACHVWECSRCGRRWNPDTSRAALARHEQECRRR